MRSRWEEQWLRTNGSEMCVRLSGQGDPILFLHGHAETSLSWRYAFDAFHESFACYAPDLAGWGRSRRGHRATLREFINDTASLIELLRLRSPVVVGHDWGAAITYGLGILRPELVRRIVTINFSPCRFQLTRALHFFFFALPLVPGIVMRMWPAAVERRLLSWWAHDSTAFPAPVLESYLRAAS